MRGILIRAWRKQSAWLLLLRPLSVVCHLYAVLRRWFFLHVRTPLHLPCRVIVVGNITVGGSGKTTLVATIAKALQTRCRVAVITRGYGRQSRLPFPVVVESIKPQYYGDEPCLLYKHLACPVVVCDNRLQALTDWANQADVLLCDDGLQDYRFFHDFELCLVDGDSGYGNGKLLPEGFLREPVSRADKCNLRLQLGGRKTGAVDDVFGYVPLRVCQLNSSISMTLEQCRAAWKHIAVHAYAALANNQRFFADLKACGIDFQEHEFLDHHAYKSDDFTSEGICLMTEKDAIKCLSFADERFWYLEIAVRISDTCMAAITDIPKRHET